uniref:NTGP4 n=1 Tax=Solanum tuberosum TaxID=4113 RepID=M1D7Y7_SOLTU
MAKSMRSKRKKRLKAIRRDIVATELNVLKKEAAKLATQEVALAAPKLIVMSPKLMAIKILDVIDTPGVDFNAESGLVVNEIGKCIDLADDGVHAVLFVLSVRTSFSKDERAAIQYFKKLFGTKISDYMIVVYTGGDKLEDNDSLNDHLDCSRPEDLKESLKDVWV